MATKSFSRGVSGDTIPSEYAIFIEALQKIDELKSKPKLLQDIMEKVIGIKPSNYMTKSYLLTTFDINSVISTVKSS